MCEGRGRGRARAALKSPDAAPGGHACAVSVPGCCASFAPRRAPGYLGPSALPSFPAVGVLPVVLSRNCPRPLQSPLAAPPFWSSGCCRSGFARLYVETAGGAGVCGCPPPPAFPEALVSVLLRLFSVLFRFFPSSPPPTTLCGSLVPPGCLVPALPLGFSAALFSL